MNSLTDEEKKFAEKMLRRMKEKGGKEYTHKELAKFRKGGIEGQVCTCRVVIANTMQLYCVRCGKVLPEFAKRYLKRK